MYRLAQQDPHLTGNRTLEPARLKRVTDWAMRLNHATLAIGAAVLGGMGVRSARVMTNNPHKAQALKGLRVRCGSCAILREARFGRQLRQAGAPHRIHTGKTKKLSGDCAPASRGSVPISSGAHRQSGDFDRCARRAAVVRHIALCRLTTGRFSSPSIGMQNYVMFGQLVESRILAIRQRVAAPQPSVCHFARKVHEA